MSERRGLGRWGIRQKLVVAVAGGPLLAAIALVYVTPQRVERQAVRALRAKANAIAGITAFSVSRGLLAHDTGSVNAALHAARENPDLAYIVITDSTGHGVATVSTIGIAAASGQRGETVDSIPEPDERWMRVATPIFTRTGRRIGTVHLGLFLDDVRDEVTAQRRLSLIAAVLFVTCGGILAFIIGTLITRPLGRLAVTATHIAEGNVDLRAEVTTDDEVAQVVQAFNTMVDSLQRARNELAEANATLEERVERRTVEVRDALTQLELAKEQAEAANRLKSDFLATMSHEVRTPMNGVLGTLSLVLESKLDDDQRRLLGLAKSSADSLLVIINDILDLSKIEAGRMEISPTPFSVRATCEDVIALLASRAHDKQLTFVFDFDEAMPPWLLGDAGRMRQVLLNLAGNAVKFTERGKVTFSVKLKERTEIDALLHISVRDTGIGIDQATLTRLFTKFVQADASMARRYGGTGLGLAISRNLIELMGGRLGVESTPGSGSTFFFDIRLPIADAPNDTEIVADGTTPRRAIPRDGTPTGARRLLVVDDNPVNLTVAAAMLKNFGHVVDLARDGSEAVAKACARQYDAIFMDLQMPVMDGFAATAAIRGREGPNKTTPIIALTANAMESDRLRSLAAGMNDHLTKPITPDALRSAIGRWCGAPVVTA